MRCLPQNGLTARATVGPTVAFLSGEEPRLWNTTHVYMHKTALVHGGDFFGDGQRLFPARANCCTSQVIARQKKARKTSHIFADGSHPDTVPAIILRYCPLRN